MSETMTAPPEPATSRPSQVLTIKAYLFPATLLIAVALVTYSFGTTWSAFLQLDQVHDRLVMPSTPVAAGQEIHFLASQYVPPLRGLAAGAFALAWAFGFACLAKICLPKE